jgi:hypothetical protein
VEPSAPGTTVGPVWPVGPAVQLSRSELQRPRDAERGRACAGAEQPTGGSPADPPPRGRRARVRRRGCVPDAPCTRRPGNVSRRRHRPDRVLRRERGRDPCDGGGAGRAAAALACGRAELGHADRASAQRPWVPGSVPRRRRGRLETARSPERLGAWRCCCRRRAGGAAGRTLGAHGHSPGRVRSGGLLPLGDVRPPASGEPRSCRAPARRAGADPSGADPGRRSENASAWLERCTTSWRTRCPGSC